MITYLQTHYAPAFRQNNHFSSQTQYNQSLSALLMLEPQNWHQNEVSPPCFSKPGDVWLPCHLILVKNNPTKLDPRTQGPLKNDKNHCTTQQCCYKFTRHPGFTERINIRLLSHSRDQTKVLSSSSILLRWLHWLLDLHILSWQINSPYSNECLWEWVFSVLFKSLTSG